MGTHRVGPSTQIGGSFPLAPRAPGEARRLLAPLGGRIPPEVLIDLELLVSEMVTNSVKHSGRSDRHVDVSIRAAPDAVRVEVRDGGPGFEPIPPRAAPPPGAGGWGLFILDRLATRWERRPEGWCGRSSTIRPRDSGWPDRWAARKGDPLGPAPDNNHSVEGGGTSRPSPASALR